MSHRTSTRYNPAAYDKTHGQANMAGGRKARIKAFCMLGLIAGLSGNANGGYIDCRTCHLDPLPDSGAPDYFEYFAEPRRQHPTGIAYPVFQGSDYNGPTGLEGDIAFFDSNGNGIADADEIQLFGITRKVECSSCHREHGDSPQPVKTKGNKRSGTSQTTNQYLRLSNAFDALCRVCHRT